jgi:lipopolysaccharide transport system ATP-binding protein
MISIESVSKRYRLGAVGTGTLREDINRWWYRVRGQEGRALRIDETARTGEEVWALKDVSLDVLAGEVLGIIGPNGAGKSTLLKILSRVTAPTSGRVTLRGRIGSLLEVGTGFHPELTGRENIFLNGAVLGMTRAEVRAKLDEIIAFSGCERYLDTPVKRYSSGMIVRLGFAVAAHLEPEILVVDEVLAVGDAEFQRRCMGKMHDVSRSGRTVLFVSHNMMAVQSLCTRAAVLKGGRVVAQGAVGDCIAQYLTASADPSGGHWSRPASSPTPAPLLFTDARLELQGEQPRHVLQITFTLRSSSPHAKAFTAFDVLDAGGTSIMQAVPRLDPHLEPREGEQRWRVAIDLPALVPGPYWVSLWVGAHNTNTFDKVDRALAFEVLDSPTPGRTFPHTRDHGYVVPDSRIFFEENGVAAGDKLG